MDSEVRAYLVAYAIGCLPSLEQIQEYGELEGKHCIGCCAPCYAVYSLIKSNEINSIFKNYYQDGQLWVDGWDWWDSERSEFKTDYFFARVNDSCPICRREQ